LQNGKDKILNPDVLIVWNGVIGTYGALRMVMAKNDVYWIANFAERILYVTLNYEK